MDWAAISECAKGLEGNKLHKEAGDKTNALVPRVRDVESEDTYPVTFPEIISHSYIIHLVYVYFTRVSAADIDLIFLVCGDQRTSSVKRKL